MVAPTNRSVLRENVGASIARPSERNNIHQEYFQKNYNIHSAPEHKKLPQGNISAAALLYSDLVNVSNGVSSEQEGNAPYCTDGNEDIDSTAEE